MADMSRRHVIVLGAIGAGVVVGGAGLLLGRPWDDRGEAPVDSATPSATAAGDAGTLREPVVMSSSSGRLALDLTAATGTVQIGGTGVHALTYNGTLPGPTP